MVASNRNQYVIEACVETLEQSVQAEKNGATRIELCARLDLGGTSPSIDLTSQVLRSINIPIKVMVRPRGGDFIYSEKELELMIETIEALGKIGIQQIVLGVLKEDRTVDHAAMKNLMEVSSEMKVTFHKAIDETPDIIEATRQLLAHPNIEAILSSGGQDTAWNGRDMLSQMVEICKADIEVVAAGKITNLNLAKIHDYIKGAAYHGRKIVGQL